MSTESNLTLTNAWQEAGEGPLLVVLVSGNGFWAFNGASAPSDDSGYIPFIKDGPGQPFYSYGGNQKTFVKRSDPENSINAVVSRTGIE